jgi:hypothetical protein
MVEEPQIVRRQVSGYNEDVKKIKIFALQNDLTTAEVLELLVKKLGEVKKQFKE